MAHKQQADAKRLFDEGAPTLLLCNALMRRGPAVESGVSASGEPKKNAAHRRAVSDKSLQTDNLPRQQCKLCYARTEATPAEPRPHPDTPPVRSWGLWVQQTMTPGWKASLCALVPGKRRHLTFQGCVKSARA